MQAARKRRLLDTLAHRVRVLAVEHVRILVQQRRRSPCPQAQLQRLAVDRLGNAVDCNAAALPGATLLEDLLRPRTICVCARVCACCGCRGDCRAIAQSGLCRCVHVCLSAGVSRYVWRLRMRSSVCEPALPGSAPGRFVGETGRWIERKGGGAALSAPL